MLTLSLAKTQRILIRVTPKAAATHADTIFVCQINRTYDADADDLLILQCEHFFVFIQPGLVFI